MNCAKLTQRIMNISGLSREFNQKATDKKNSSRLLELKDQIIFEGLEIRRGFLRENNFDRFYKYVEGRSVAVKDDRKYFIDPLGRKILNFAKDGFEEVKDFSESRAKVKKDGKWYYIDPDGKKIGNFAEDGFDKCSSFSNGEAQVIRNGAYFTINKIGIRTITNI